MEKKEQIRISVRNLVEFVLKSGNIDNRKSSRQQKDAMLVGSRLHKKIQSRQQGDYRAEVSLRYAANLSEPFELVVEGRADGIFHKDDISVIDEIKVTYLDQTKLEDAILVHKAQAICYGYMYAMMREELKVGIQITYCHPETEEIRQFYEIYHLEALQEEFYIYVREYAKWAHFLYEHCQARNQSLQSITFPFSYRNRQREIVVAAYKHIVAKKKLFIQAPTGIGKTLSVMFPSIAAMGQQKVEKIFYLTAKTITRNAPQEAVRLLQKRHAKLSSVVITAKEKLCPLENMDCNPIACSYAKGHFDRVNAAVYDLITHEENADRECILRYAQAYQVCPFEMCLDVTYWMDIIICDYNYVFDPNVRLQRFFAEGESGDYVFLVDEAHNLVDRAREMYSASLCKEDFLEAKKEYKELPLVAKKIESCNRKLLVLKRECDAWKQLPDGEGTSAFLHSLQSLYNDLIELSEKYPHWNPSKKANEFFFQVRNYLQVQEELDENYRVYTEHTEDGRFYLNSFCINPSKRLNACCNQGCSTIFFSATCLPILYYKELLAGNKKEDAIYIPSPFDQKKRMIGIASDVTTKYTRRNQKEYIKYAEYIQGMLESRKGNYLVFFPSYQYLQNVLEACMIPNGYRVAVQENNLTEEKREAFLALFEEKEIPTVGFCVLGGIFSEGIDLQKEAVIGVAIAGTGLAQVSPRQEIIRQFYQEKGEDGYAFSYFYPGMNKVLQAAGRLIRTVEDYGVILLLDERFLRTDHMRQFPMEWQEGKILKIETHKQILGEFWESVSNLLDR